MSGRRITISDKSRTRVKGTFEPIALAMGRAGLTPNALTLIGFGITVVGAVLLSQQQWLAGGLVVFAGGVFDMFDGTLTRATGKVSAFGAFMDSVFDRWGEALTHLGLIVGATAAGLTELAVVAGTALIGAFMVSYTRAKAEGLGFSAGSGMATVGIMPREVRLVVLTMGLVIGGLLLPTTDPTLGILIIKIALAIIAVGATITTIQRILHVRDQANSNGEAGK